LFDVVINPELTPIFDKLKSKDPEAYQNLKRKIEQVTIILESNLNHYKNLKKPLQDYKRVHINQGFVLIFRVDKKNKRIIIADYEHHDNVYKKSHY
jgi:Cytotoxic translational repressor of toxin-antitoxin stability system